MKASIVLFAAALLVSACSTLPADTEDTLRAELNQSAADRIARARQFAESDLDHKQLDAIDTRRKALNQLAMHPDPQIRRKALEGLATLDTTAWLEDIESRREARADTRAELWDEVYRQCIRRQIAEHGAGGPVPDFSKC